MLSLDLECLLLIIISNSIGMDTKPVIPVSFESIGDKTVVGIDFHIASACEFGIIARPLEVLAAQDVGLRGAGLKFALNCEA